MKSFASPSFWNLFRSLPEDIQKLAEKNYQLWQANPRHPSLRFKPIKSDFWSVRVGAHYRAVGRFRDDRTFLWLWIGTHEEYSKL